MKSEKINQALRALGFSLALVMMCAAAAGCRGGKETVLQGGARLTYWAPITDVAATLSSNWGDMPLYQELQKRTGVEVTFIHPSTANIGEQFSLLLASDTLPDIIQYNWSIYSGGPGKAIKDGVIIDLYEHKERLQNLSSYLEANEEVKKNAVTSDGQLFAAPFIRGDKTLCVSLGIALRQDWLEELGLETPQTISEWERTLTQFKEKKGAAAPLNIGLDTLRYGLFSGAYGTCYDYYLKDGKVTHGILDSGFKETLTKLNEWYRSGLLDRDFATVNSATRDSNLLNGKTGAMQMSLGGGIGRYLSSTPDEKFDLVGARPPVLNQGDYPEFGFYQTQVPPTMRSTFTAVSADCKNMDAALKLLDYGYSEDGHMLYNFGIEGESYILTDGYPKYTENITDNKEGYAMNVMLSQYCQSYDGGPFVQDKRYMEQYAARPQQQAAWDIWTQSNMSGHLLPNLYVSGEDQTELSNLDISLTTYMDEIVTKLIMGTEPLDNYGKIMANLKDRGIERSIEIRQKAYDAYLRK